MGEYFPLCLLIFDEKTARLPHCELPLSPHGVAPDLAAEKVRLSNI